MKECTVCSRCFPDQVNHCPGDGELLKHTLNGETVLDGRYQLEKRIGQGGMGMVFKARHIFLKTQHAIKVILPDLVGNDPSLATRFRQEAMAAAAIQHPNTVSVTDYGLINNTMPFLVMEFVEGRSLHDIIQVEGKLSPAVALEFILAVCAGVGAAHRQEIVHRDLKPLNILLKNGQAPREGVKVLDFGLAKIKSGELLGSFVAAQTQGMMGSPYYMAPEQWSDEDVDRRADIYSLGVILYQMLAGDVPFKGNSVPSIMNKHLTAQPMPMHDRGVFVPPELEQAVRHALEKDVTARPQTIEEFSDELREAAAAIGDAAKTGKSGEIGMRTLQIPPGDTMGGATPERGTATNEQPGGASGHGATGDAQPALQTGIVEKKDAGLQAGVTGESRPSVPLVVNPHAGIGSITKPLTDSAPPDGAPPRGTETAHQRADATAFHPGLVEDEAPRVSRGEAPTAMLDTGQEARRGAEMEREREEEERRAREAEDGRRREAEQARLREEAERERREAEEQRRRQEEQERATASEQRPVGEDTGQYTPTPTPVPPPRPPALLFVVGALVALLLLGGVAVVAYFVAPEIIARFNGANTNANVTPNLNANANNNGGANGNANAGPRPTPPAKFKPDPVAFPGGSYQMGRAEVPPVSDQSNRRYLLWLYSQWPAHPVSVGPFAMDRTEVTNAEYAVFIRETKRAAPPGWEGSNPLEGSESLPVNNVSYEDAEKFAEWRSQRDQATYRLPTEEEWEYAARGGGETRVYPWGDSWAVNRANLNASAPKAVGSFPQGRTPQGLDDMIGNVWEWTRSPATMYKGNDRTRLEESDRAKMIVRGGSYGSAPDGSEPITVTSRRWVARDLRDPVLGFRLVRVGP